MKIDGTRAAGACLILLFLVKEIVPGAEKFLPLAGGDLEQFALVFGMGYIVDELRKATE